MTDQIMVSTLLRLNWYNPPVIILEKKKRVPSMTDQITVSTLICVNLHNPPVILLEKKKKGSEHDWSDNGLNSSSFELI